MHTNCLVEVFSNISKGFKHGAAGSVAVLALVFNAADVQQASAQTQMSPEQISQGFGFHRFRGFMPVGTQHLASRSDDKDFYEINPGLLVGYDLRGKPDAEIFYTLYAGGFRNSFGDFAQMVNVTAETANGLKLFGVENLVGGGIAVGVSRYPERSLGKGRDSYLYGGIPYLRFLSPHDPVNMQTGYIPLGGGVFFINISFNPSSIRNGNPLIGNKGAIMNDKVVVQKTQSQHRDFQSDFHSREARTKIRQQKNIYRQSIPHFQP